MMKILPIAWDSCFNSITEFSSCTRHSVCVCFIKWPDRETLQLTMPSSFRKFFKKCAIIIDCSEVFIERASDLLVTAQVWSNYKHHSTVKFLIGIMPQGTISFVSENCLLYRVAGCPLFRGWLKY